MEKFHDARHGYLHCHCHNQNIKNNVQSSTANDTSEHLYGEMSIDETDDNETAKRSFLLSIGRVSTERKWERMRAYERVLLLLLVVLKLKLCVY